MGAIKLVAVDVEGRMNSRHQSGAEIWTTVLAPRNITNPFDSESESESEAPNKTGIANNGSFLWII